MSTTVTRRSVEQAIQPRHRRRPPAIDWWMILAVGGLVAVSLTAIAGATRSDIGGDSSYFVTRQAIYALFGLLVAAGLAKLDYGVLQGARRGAGVVVRRAAGPAVRAAGPAVRPNPAPWS